MTQQTDHKDAIEEARQYAKKNNLTLQRHIHYIMTLSHTFLEGGKK